MTKNRVTRIAFTHTKSSSFLQATTLLVFIALILSPIIFINMAAETRNNTPDSKKISGAHLPDNRDQTKIEKQAQEQNSKIKNSKNYLEIARQHQAKKEYSQAITNYKQALASNPNNFQAHFHLANIYSLLEQNKKAHKHYQTAISINPYIPEAYFNYGLLLESENKSSLAIKNYKQAIELKPDYIKAFIQIGKTLKNKKQYYKAISYLTRALHIEHDNFQVHYYLGKIYYEIDLLDYATYYFERAIVKNPQSAIALTDYGNTLNMLNKTQEALNIYAHVLQLVPNEPSANYNYAYTLKKLNKIDESFYFYEKALELSPNTPYIHFGVAIAYLTYGNFIKGFEAYEWRWKTGKLNPRIFDKPLWDGSSLQDKILFLHAEQGLGDTFQFIRYAKVAHDMGAQVIFAAPNALQKIISLCPYTDQVIPLGKQPRHFDYHAPLMSMPFLCKTTIDTVPRPIPYLYADNNLIQHWQETLSKDKNLKIGICWQGNKKHSSKFLTYAFASKSIQLTHFEPLSQLEQVSLYSLQKVQGEEQIEQAKDIINLHVFDNNFDNTNGRFMDTAAVIKNLDLVITVDTSIAHLAGGLGVETWVILPEPADWRWMLHRLDTPWYPTIKLFRQKESGNWKDVIQDVVNTIKKKLQITGINSKASFENFSGASHPKQSNLESNVQSKQRISQYNKQGVA